MDEKKVEIKNGFRLILRLSEAVELSEFNGEADVYDIIADNEIVEARYFNSEKELRIFKSNGEFGYCIIEDVNDGLKAETAMGTDIMDSKDYFTEEEYKIISKKSKNIKEKIKFEKIKEKRYVFFDDDGQAYVKITRLCGAE